MSGQTTEIIHPQSMQPPKKFNFNYSYWSHDGYNVREDGYHEPKDRQYADQVRFADRHRTGWEDQLSWVPVVQKPCVV